MACVVFCHRCDKSLKDFIRLHLYTPLGYQSSVVLCLMTRCSAIERKRPDPLVLTDQALLTGLKLALRWGGFDFLSWRLALILSSSLWYPSASQYHFHLAIG